MLLDNMQKINECVQKIFNEKKKYLSTIFVLLTAFFYNNIIVPTEIKRVDGKSKNGSAVDSPGPPTVFGKQPENIYEGVMQSSKGDVYRVAFEARGGNSPQLEIFIHSSNFYETTKVGEVDIESTNETEWKELIFTTPGKYDSIIIRLKESEKDEIKWDNKFVFVDSLSVSRLDINSNDISLLSPTIIDVQGMPFSRLEDMGVERLYTFSIRNDRTDYENIFEATNSVMFDKKKKAVVAAKKNGEYFIYKFDTQYPIKKLSMKALQKGSDEDEIHLQYSFNGTSWKTIEYSQDAGRSQEFFLSIDREIPETKFFFVKASYEGKDKNSGTFALEELEINALVIDNERRF